MKLIRFTGYFSRLRMLIGFTAACAFTLSYIWNKTNPPSGGRLAHVQVGPYVFYFPSFEYFEGLFTEIFFKETYYISETREPIRVIDCGANIGMSLLYIKIRAPHALVTCFEPNPAARAVLEKNIAANGWGEDVQIFPYALGKKKGTANFFVDDKEATSSGGSMSLIAKNKDQKLDSYLVDVDTLSSYVYEKVDFLKMDIEGGEFDVLEELASQNKFCLISEIQLEYHYVPRVFTRPLSDMLKLFELAGFKTFVQSNAQAYQILGQESWHTYMVFAWR